MWEMNTNRIIVILQTAAELGMTVQRDAPTRKRTVEVCCEGIVREAIAQESCEADLRDRKVVWRPPGYNLA